MSQICSKMVIFLFSAYFGSHFCYHSNLKSRINTRPLLFGYCSNKLIRTCKEQLLFFDLIGGPKQPLNAHTPLVKFYQFILKILSGNTILTSVKGHNSITNVRKMMWNNTNLDLVSFNAYTQYGNILSFCSRLIKYDGQNDRLPKSSIALF